MDDGPNPYSPPNEPSVEPTRKVVQVDDTRLQRIPGPVIVATLIAVAFLYAFIAWLRN